MTTRELIGKIKLKHKKNDLPTGVYFNRPANKYASTIKIGKRAIWLGNFESIKEAEVMYKKAVSYQYLFKGIPKYFRSMLHEVALNT